MCRGHSGTEPQAGAGFLHRPRLPLNFPDRTSGCTCACAAVWGRSCSLRRSGGDQEACELHECTPSNFNGGFIFLWHAPQRAARTLSPGVVTRESMAAAGSEAYEHIRFYVTQSNIKTIICFTARDFCAVGAPIKAARKSVYKVGLFHQPRALDIAQAVTFSF